MPGGRRVQASTMEHPAHDLGMRRIVRALKISADKKISLIEAGSQQCGPNAVTFPAWDVSHLPGQAG